MIPYLGDFIEDDVVFMMFNTFTSDDPGASCTITDFINTDVHIHKDDGLTQRNNAAGITVSTNFDGITGSHMIKIDTNDNTVAGFWVTGADYFVRIEGTTIDGATINAVVGHFSIQNRFMRGTNGVDSILTAIAGATFATGTDSLEAIRNRGDAAWTTGAGGSAPTVEQIRAEMDANSTRMAPSQVLADYKANVSNLDVAVSTRNATTPPTVAQIRTEMDANSTKMAPSQTLADYKATGFATQNPPSQVLADYKADVSNLDVAVSSRNATTPPSVGAIDTELAGTHGAGSWEGGAAAPTVGEIRSEMEKAGTKLTILGADWLNGGRLDNLLDAIPTTAMRGTNSAALATALATHDGKLDTADALIDRILAATEVRQGTVAAAGATTTKFISSLTEPENDYWDRMAVLFTSGNNTGQMRRIKSYNGATKEITVQTPLDTAPANGDAFVMPVVRAFITPDIEDIADAVMDELIGDHTVAGSLSKGVADILADTNELQLDWKDAGRLDAILDAIPTTAMRGTDGANTATPPTVGAIDTELSGTHGAGSWEGGGAAPTVGEIDTELTANHGAGGWITGGGGAAPTVGEIREEMEKAGTKLTAIDADLKEGGRLDLLIDAILEDTSTTLDDKVATLTTALAVHDQNMKALLFSEY